MVVYIKEMDALFMHIPKCGGTSIRGMKCANIGAFTPTKYIDSFKEYSNTFRFTFVRNPYDRMISSWKMAIDGSNDMHWFNERFNRIKIGTNEKRNSFEQFVHYAIYLENTNNLNMTRLEELVYMHTMPMIYTFNGLNVSKYPMDFIGRLETFDSDFKRLCEMRNAEPRPLPKRNATKHDHYSTYYTPETIKIVTDYYKEDLETFNYKFEEE